MEGHSAPASADVPAATGEAPAPVQSNVHSHPVHHDQGSSQAEKETPRKQITPRPTFLENLADSRDSQFMLNRRDSDDLDRYFVGLLLPGRPENRAALTQSDNSMALETSTSTQNGQSSCECTAASCPK